MKGLKLVFGLRVCTYILMVFLGIGSIVGAIVLFCTGYDGLIGAGVGILFGGILLVIVTYYLFMTIAYTAERVSLLSAESNQQLSDSLDSQVLEKEGTTEEKTPEVIKPQKQIARISNYSSLSARYAINVSIDGEFIVTIEKDQVFDVEVEKGDHLFRFENAENKKIFVENKYKMDRLTYFVLTAKSDGIKVVIN